LAQAGNADAGASATARTALTRWREHHPQPRATVRDVADHLERAREIAGIDHLGIGGDFDGTDSLPIGLEDVSTYPALFAELASRRWTPVDLRKLAGQNVLRVMRDVEAAADEPMWPSRLG